MNDEFDLETSGVLAGRAVIEASAGTGKTFSLAGVVVRHVVDSDLEMSQLLVVTFTNDAAAELCQRVRAQLVEARRTLVEGCAPDAVPWLAVLLDDRDLRDVRLARLDRAIATFDEATISTIHGFCQQSLRQIGQRAGLTIGAELGAADQRLVREVCRDLLIATVAADPDAVSWTTSVSKDGTVNHPDISKVLSTLIATVSTLFSNPGATAIPSIDGFEGARKGDTPERLERWIDLVGRCTDEIRRRRSEAGLLTFDDLIVSMRDAVRDFAVVAALREKFRLVLVDEFQDTDPLQWEIFESAFGPAQPVDPVLVTVGDPKQAIYRFRGADIHAYLHAVEGEPKKNLSTNFRSDASLVSAMNVIFDGVELGDSAIVAGSVQSHPGAIPTAMLAGSPFQIRVLEGGDDFLTPGGKGQSTPLLRRAILTDLVAQVLDLLDNQEIFLCDEPRSIVPSDIAVLAQSNSLAEAVVSALQRSKIPAVRARSGSVLSSPIVEHLLAFFEAMAAPSYAPVVRAAALGPFLRLAPSAIDPNSPDADRRLAEVQRKCAEWAEEMANRPFLGWFDLVRAESGVVARLLGEPDGDRLLTDLDHLAEVLASELGDEASNPFAVAAALRDLKSEVDDEGVAADDRKRRIESDEGAVVVTTIHSSKGLEFPIVLIPFAWIPPSGGKGPSIDVFHDADADARCVDIASRQDWVGGGTYGSHQRREFEAKVEKRGDHLRLLYVALTRARNRTILWWAPDDNAAKHGLNAILFDRDEDGNPLNSPVVRDGLAPSKLDANGIPRIANPADPRAALKALVTRGAGAISVDLVTPGSTPGRWTRPARSVGRAPLAVARTNGRTVVDRSWRRWSFSQITRSGHRPSESVPVAGGYDESLSLESSLTSTRIVVPAIEIPSTADVAVPLADLVAGQAVGDFVHRVLEHLDPTATDLAAAVALEVERLAAWKPAGVDTASLVAGLVESLRSPLGALFGGRRLADIGPADRLAETRFDFPLGSPSAANHRATITDVGRALLSTLAPDDPQRAYAELLASGALRVELAGFMQGSIDAVFRVDAGERFVVVDYKSNRLHAPGDPDALAAYHPDLLPEAMASSHYVLQALVYSVAVHRFLALRVADYDPERHLGGVAYLFLRGMVGEPTPMVDGRPYGVFSWNPPAAAIVAVDRLLRDGVS